MTYQEFFSKYSYNRHADCVMKGRFGAIYKATSSKRNEEVYLRVMRVGEHSDEVTLRQEVEFVEALPSCPYIVRYRRSYRFEEATGEIDCALMDYYPLGNLIKVLEDWKLDNGERRGLRRRIIEAIEFLRGNEVNVGPFDPETIFVTEENSELIPHLIDISGKMTDNPDYERQLTEFLPDLPEPALTEEAKAVEPEVDAADKSEAPAVQSIAQSYPEPASVPEATPVPEADADTDSEADFESEYTEEEIQEEDPENNGRKWKLLMGVIVTWIAIFTLIGVLHAKRNATEAEEANPAAADTAVQVVYPADEFAAQEAARADSIAKAKADSIAAFKADSIAYLKKIAAEKEKKAKPEEKKAPETEPQPKTHEEPLHHKDPKPEVEVKEVVHEKPSETE